MEDVAKQKISCAEQQLSMFVLKLYIVSGLRMETQKKIIHVSIWN